VPNAAQSVLHASQILTNSQIIHITDLILQRKYSFASE